MSVKFLWLKVKQTPDFTLNRLFNPRAVKVRVSATPNRASVNVAIPVWSAIDKIIQLLDASRLVIHSNCTDLLSEIGSYRRKLKDGIPTDTIEDKDTYHLLDALRYLVTFLTDMSGEQEQIVYNPVRIGNY